MGVSLAARHEAAQRRLSASARQTELVDQAIRTLDEQLAVHGLSDSAGLLRNTARAMLVVAYGMTGYDVAFAPAGGQVVVRVQHTEFGLEVDLVAAAPSGTPAPVVGEEQLVE